MAYLTPKVLCFLAFLLCSNGFRHSSKDSSCSDWIPYKNEKCIKLVDQAGLQTKIDAQVICNAFVEEFPDEDIPRLITIETEEKQKFLEKLVFEDLHYLENVWLGLELGRDDIFHWNDGVALSFTNWLGEPKVDPDRDCVQMDSGEGSGEKGKWVVVSCAKRNVIVCERTQPTTIATLLDSIENLKLEVTRINQAWEQKFEETHQEILYLKQNPDPPKGFIYKQLPGQDPPTLLWPRKNWTEVSDQYAGLFFRVLGQNTATFGQTQDADTSRLEEVKIDSDGPANAKTKVPSDGGWSGPIYSGHTIGNDSRIALKFRLSKGEVRPRNQALKLWQCLG